MVHNAATFSYGNSPQFGFETVRTGNGEGTFVYKTLSAQRAEVKTDDYYDALDDINKSFRVVADETTGKTFEIAIANLDSTEDTVDAEISTFNSSISNNVGNAAEFAMHAASHPGRRRLYIASPGNGGSSHLEKAERRFVRKSGSFVDADGGPIPTLTALARVLKHEDLHISRFATDSAGGAYATALMPALSEGQITHAYLKSRPGIMSHPDRFRWAARFFVGENLDSKHYRKFTEDPWNLTDERIQEARGILTGVYDKENKGEWTNTAAVAHGGLSKILADMEAFSRPGAARDTAYALRAQPMLKMTHHLPIGDRLYGSDILEGVERYLTQTEKIAKKIVSESYSLAGVDASLEVALLPGTHHDHSQYPTLRQSMEAYAFSK